MNEKSELRRLVHQAKNGNVAAFEEIFHRYAKYVYYTAWKMVKNEQDALDLMQDIMIKLYTSMEKIRDGSTLTSYIRQITYNTCLNHIKRGQLIKWDEYEEEPMQKKGEYATENEPEEFMLQKFQQEQLLTAIDKLSPSLRSVVLMYYLEGISISEIAEALETSENSIYLRLSRARNGLKKHLEKDKNNKDLSNTMFSGGGILLTKLLREEAGQVSAAKLDVVWEQVADKLMLAVAAPVAATTTVAAGSKITAWLLGGIGAAAVVALGVQYAVPQSVEYIEPATVAAEAVIPSSNTLDDAEELLVTPDVEIPVVVSDFNGITYEEEENPQETEELEEEVVEEVVEPAPIPQTMRLQLQNVEMTVSAGTRLTKEEILIYAQPYCTEDEAVFEVGFLDEADLDSPGEYGICIYATLGDTLDYRIFKINVVAPPAGAQKQATDNQITQTPEDAVDMETKSADNEDLKE